MGFSCYPITGLGDLVHQGDRPSKPSMDYPPPAALLGRVAHLSFFLLGKFGTIQWWMILDVCEWLAGQPLFSGHDMARTNTGSWKTDSGDFWSSFFLLWQVIDERSTGKKAPVLAWKWDTPQSNGTITILPHCHSFSLSELPFSIFRYTTFSKKAIGQGGKATYFPPGIPNATCR